MTCPSGSSYIVQSGDRLVAIAQRLLGDSNRWIEITKPDGTHFTEQEAEHLQVGQEICLPGGSSPQSNVNVEELLAAQNRYRAEVGVPPLTWSGTLAQSAQQWANQIAATGQFQHSGTPGVGENLWAGTTKAFSQTQMVDSWGSEKANFIPGGTFPDVSSTGNWADVGHYTQLVWRNTTQVGCAIASDGQNDYLVCQYSPEGNFLGEKVY